VLADIGTDHAYLPISACLSSKVERAIACDLNPAPLLKARENIIKYRLQDRITTRLGYGLQPLQSGEADTIVIAGIGGINIIEMLKDLPDDFRIQRLIIQPQRDIKAVRRALTDFSFVDEISVLENDRFYDIIVVKR